MNGSDLCILFLLGIGVLALIFFLIVYSEQGEDPEIHIFFTEDKIKMDLKPWERYYKRSKYKWNGQVY